MEEGQTTQAFNFGNEKDDDGQVFESLFQENYDPGLPFPDTAGTVPAKNIETPTRLISGSRVLTIPASQPEIRPVLLLPRDYNRCDLSLFFTPYETTSVLSPVTALGAAATGPLAAQTLVSIPASSLPAGWYTINAVYQTYGTTASPTDDNNFQLQVVVGSNVQVVEVVQMYSGTSGSVRTERTYRVYLDGTQLVRVRTVGAATATAIYETSLMITRADTTTVTGQATVLIGYDQASLQTESVSARINLSNLAAPLRLAEHTGEVWATLLPAPENQFSTVKVSWIATSK